MSSVAKDHKVKINQNSFSIQTGIGNSNNKSEPRPLVAQFVNWKVAEEVSRNQLTFRFLVFSGDIKWEN